MGYKDIENRSWKMSNHGLKFRGEFLIHASGSMTKAECEGCFETVRAIPGMREKIISDGHSLNQSMLGFLMGGILGIAEIIDVVYEHPSPWFFGKQGLVIRNARPLPFTPCNGQLGFFNPPADALEKLKGLI